jgi:hypothetical protein
MNGKKKHCVYLPWNITQPERKVKLCHWRKIKGTGDHHVE